MKQVPGQRLMELGVTIGNLLKINERFGSKQMKTIRDRIVEQIGKKANEAIDNEPVVVHGKLRSDLIAILRAKGSRSKVEFFVYSKDVCSMY